MTDPGPWCVDCEEYRVLTPGQSCPICRDERKEQAK